jgi:hypothetical protein
LAKLPAAAAAQVLVGSQRYVPAGESLPAGVTAAVAIQPLHAMQIECLGQGDQDYGSVRIAVDLRGLQERIHTQTTRFFMVAAMLVLSLATGMWLLLRSVVRDLDNARRTENFVAAVTHEVVDLLLALALDQVLARLRVALAQHVDHLAAVLAAVGHLQLQPFPIQSVLNDRRTLHVYLHMLLHQLYVLLHKLYRAVRATFPYFTCVSKG